MFRFGLRHLKVWQKLTLIVAVMSMAIPVIFYLISTRDTATIDFAENERYGNEYLLPARQLFAHAIAYRDLTAAVIEGQASYAAQLPALQKSIEQEISAIDEVHAARGHLLANNVALMPKRLNELKAVWSSLKVAPVEPGKPSTLHTAFVGAVSAVITQVGDSSNLILDPDIDTYYLMSALITMLPQLADDLGSARSLATGVAGRAAITNDERLRLAALLGRVQLNLDATRKGMVDSAFVYNKSLAPIVTADLDAAVRDVGAFQRIVDEQLTRADQVKVPRSSVFEAGTTAMDQVFKLYALQLQELDRLLQIRIGKFESDRFYVVAVTGVGMVIAILLAALIARAITRQITSILQVFQKLGMGDYQARVVVDATDEIGVLTTSLNAMLDNVTGLMQSRDERDQMQSSIQKLLEEVSGVGEGDLTAEAEVTADMTGAIADSFNQMIAELRKVIGQVQGATVRVSKSAQELEATTHALAEGSEKQALQIVDTSAAVEAMAASISQVSANAASSAAVAEQSRTNADQGTRAVSRTIEGMSSIRDQVQETAKRIKRLGESSQEIGEIVELIGDIADRTSILALNASIQAAMAGEAGRGFAVVAEEVERLAERATEATRRISTLIKTTQSETAEAVAAMEDTTREVVRGSELANEAGTALTEIKTVSDRLAQLIQAISDAARQQSKGSEQVAKSMSQISDHTRQTAAATKDTAASIGSLAALSSQLNASMARFKLPSTGAGQRAA